MIFFQSPLRDLAYVSDWAGHDIFQSPHIYVNIFQKHSERPACVGLAGHDIFPKPSERPDVCLLSRSWDFQKSLRDTCRFCVSWAGHNIFPKPSERPQELEVLSLSHLYSLKTKISPCHYVVMTRSETKFQAPLNRRYQEVFGEKWTSNHKNYVNRACEAWITFSDISPS